MTNEKTERLKGEKKITVDWPYFMLNKKKILKA